MERTHEWVGLEVRPLHGVPLAGVVVPLLGGKFAQALLLGLYLLEQVDHRLRLGPRLQHRGRDHKSATIKFGMSADVGQWFMLGPAAE